MHSPNTATPADGAALDRLLPHVYEQLRRLAPRARAAEATP
jgi:hypothetical protein